MTNEEDFDRWAKSGLQPTKLLAHYADRNNLTEQDINEIGAIIRYACRQKEAELQRLREGVRYWSYCTRQGMLTWCPEKREELAEWLKSVGVEP